MVRDTFFFVMVMVIMCHSHTCVGSEIKGKRNTEQVDITASSQEENGADYRKIIDKDCPILKDKIQEILDIWKDSAELMLRAYGVRMFLRPHSVCTIDRTLGAKHNDFLETMPVQNNVKTFQKQFRELISTSHARLSHCSEFDPALIRNSISLPLNTLMQLQNSHLKVTYDWFCETLQEEFRLLESSLHAHRSDVSHKLRFFFKTFLTDRGKYGADHKLASTMEKVIKASEEEGRVLVSEFYELKKSLDMRMSLIYSWLQEELKVVVELKAHQDTSSKKRAWQELNNNLFSAAQKGNIEAVTKHLEEGADVHTVINDLTPFEIALQNGHMQCAQILFMYTKKANYHYKQQPLYFQNTPGQFSPENPYHIGPPSMQLGGAGGAAPSWNVEMPGTTTSLNQLLIRAVIDGNAEIAEQLINEGADRNQRVNGKPLLHIAFELGHIRCANVLTADVADVYDE